MADVATVSRTADPAVDHQADASARRCPELTRTHRGYEMCHLDEHDPSTPHHVRDRSWSTSTPTPRLKLGQPCGDACAWPEHVVPYLGTAPRTEGGTTRVRRR